jgi:HSP20 family protein
MTVKRIGAWLEATRDYVELDRLLAEGWVICQQMCVWQPPTDVYEDDDGVVVRVEVAGIRREDFSISLVDRRLTITGSRVDPAPKRTYHQMEIRFGEFRVEVYLPWQVASGDVEATYQEGFLQVSLPRPRLQRVPIVEVQTEED